MPDLSPTDRELEALKVLWERGEATIREIADAMNTQAKNGGEAEVAYTTVLSLLQVMEQKGLVGHTASGKVYSYFAKVDRERTFQRLARGFLDRVFDGALDEYVLHALEARRLSADDLARLEQLLSAAKANQPRRKRKEDTP